jgi:hypothetical protein
MKEILYRQFELQLGALGKDGEKRRIKSRQVEPLGWFP